MCKVVDKLTTEEVINEVKGYSILWDSTLESYQNKILRTRAWRSLMAELFPQLHTMTSAEQNEIEHALRRKWKGIRTCYARELLKQKNEPPNTVGRKQYQYFDQLRFLDIVPRNDPVAEEGSEIRAASPKNTNVSVPLQRPVKKVSTTTTTNVKRKAERNINENPPKKQAVKYRNLELENEADKMFLLSLVPDLQKVPPEIKLQLKSDIINSILRAQQQDPLSGSQLYVTEDNPNMSGTLNLPGGKLYNSVMFHRNLRDFQQDNQDEDIFTSSNQLSMEFIKTETAESVSSTEDRGSLVGSEDCDIFLA